MPDILSDFYNNCNPVKPALASQYVDSDAARGSRDLVKQFHNDLKNVRSDFLCFLFTGHLGCGKSSELRHLAETLSMPDPKLNTPAFFPVYLNAEDFIDTYDADPRDILLSVLAAAAREFDKIGIKLQDNYLWRKLDDVKNVLFTDVGLSELGTEGKLPFLSKVTAKFNVLKSDPTNRDLVRKAFGRDIAPLKEEIKLQFEKARGLLAKKKSENGILFKDFVLIIDNLEKIDRVSGKDVGYISHRQLFIESASQLLGLGAHVVYTVPLPLVINNGTELKTIYGTAPFILPMIKVEDRPPQRKRYKTGWETMKEIVDKRLPVHTARNQVIQAKALDFLIRYSGGHTRELIMFLRQAVTLVDKPPITLKAAQMAIADTVVLFSAASAAHLQKLAELELSPDQSVIASDQDIKTMLQQLIILEYRNGSREREEDPFNPATPWYSVHPLIRELKPFKRAVENLNSLRAQTVERSDPDQPPRPKRQSK